MNKKILIITVFISNLAFATVIPVEFLETNISSSKENRLSNKVIAYLDERGIEDENLEQRVKNSFAGNENTTNAISQKMMQEFDAINENSIIKYFANCVLREKKIDLNSQKGLVDLIQSVDYRLLSSDSFTKVLDIVS